MNLSLSSLALMVPGLLIIEGFFAGSELALLSADKLRLKSDARKGSRRARLALELANHPERILSSTLLMTSLCVVGISSLIELYLLQIGHKHPEFATIVITSPLIVLLGELAPKTVYQRYADRFAPWVAYPVAGVYWALFPLTRTISAYTNRLSRLLGPLEEMLTGRQRSTREEIRTLLTYGKNETDLKPSEKRMIKRIFDFKDTEAKHALIPLVRIEGIEEHASVQMVLERFKAHRHSRMPVFSGRIDNIVGILDVSDLFSMTDISQPIRGFITPAHYVAETQSLEDLLLEMHRENDEMVVVVDEYGGAVGILTLEDIVEEIVGEIQDEYDSEASLHKQLSPDSWLVQARMEIAQINELLRLELPEGDYETLGGFLLQQFGRIPENRDELYFDTPAGNFKFTIRKANERAIESVLVERMSSPEPT